MRFAILALMLSACVVDQGGGDGLTPPIGQVWHCDMSITYGLAGTVQMQDSRSYDECFLSQPEAVAWVQDWYATTCVDMITAKNYGGGGQCGGGCEVEKLNLCSYNDQ